MFCRSSLNSHGSQSLNTGREQIDFFASQAIAACSSVLWPTWGIGETPLAQRYESKRSQYADDSEFVPDPATHRQALVEQFLGPLLVARLLLSHHGLQDKCIPEGVVIIVLAR